jgi:hypothetical protein
MIHGSFFWGCLLSFAIKYFALRLGPCITKTHRPPGLNSNCSKVVVKPLGPHHCARCSGFSNAAKTLRALADNRR